jgi:hypothetical protein
MIYMYDFYSPLPCEGSYSRQPTMGSQQMIPSPGSSYQMPQMGSTLPTGMPLGPAPSGVPGSPAFPVPVGPTPTTVQSTMFTAGYLKTQIGRKVRVEFLIGVSSMTDRTGTLTGVGASYILIRPEETDDIMLCDLYSIKFVTFFY